MPFFDAASAHGELIAAVIAEEHTSLRLAFHAADANRTTVRAEHAVNPTRGFKVRKSLGFVVKNGVGDIDIHGGLPC